MKTFIPTSLPSAVKKKTKRATLRFLASTLPANKANDRRGGRQTPTRMAETPCASRGAAYWVAAWSTLSLAAAQGNPLAVAVDRWLRSVPRAKREFAAGGTSFSAAPATAFRTARRIYARFATVHAAVRANCRTCLAADGAAEDTPVVRLAVDATPAGGLQDEAAEWIRDLGAPAVDPRDIAPSAANAPPATSAARQGLRRVLRLSQETLRRRLRELFAPRRPLVSGEDGDNDDVTPPDGTLQQLLVVLLHVFVLLHVHDGNGSDASPEARLRGLAEAVARTFPWAHAGDQQLTVDGPVGTALFDALLRFQGQRVVTESTNGGGHGLASAMARVLPAVAAPGRRRSDRLTDGRASVVTIDDPDTWVNHLVYPQGHQTPFRVSGDTLERVQTSYGLTSQGRLAAVARTSAAGLQFPSVVGFSPHGASPTPQRWSPALVQRLRQLLHRNALARLQYERCVAHEAAHRVRSHQKHPHGAAVDLTDLLEATYLLGLRETRHHLVHLQRLHRAGASFRHAARTAAAAHEPAAAAFLGHPLNNHDATASLHQSIVRNTRDTLHHVGRGHRNHHFHPVPLPPGVVVAQRARLQHAGGWCLARPTHVPLGVPGVLLGHHRKDLRLGFTGHHLAATQMTLDVWCTAAADAPEPHRAGTCAPRTGLRVALWDAHTQTVGGVVVEATAATPRGEASVVLRPVRREPLRKSPLRVSEDETFLFAVYHFVSSDRHDRAVP